jgi:hypothetical protein
MNDRKDNEAMTGDDLLRAADRGRSVRLKPLTVAMAMAGLLAAGAVGAWTSHGLSAARVPVATSMPAVAVMPASGPGSAVSRDAVETAAPVSAASATAQDVPIPPVPAPNYRAIVERFGPSVVGIRVAGTRAVADGASDDPMQQFFRGVPGMVPQPRADVPFRGQGSWR